ncbi:MAG: 4Fe-4S ferredoxin, partial [Nitrospina sp.]|nr:4Fe-4S ferredoxin [Nitrospina sp.]
GCKKCISKGPMDTFLEGCPWDAIDMLPLDKYEEKFGTLPY